MLKRKSMYMMLIMIIMINYSLAAHERQAIYFYRLLPYLQ